MTNADLKDSLPTIELDKGAAQGAAGASAAGGEKLGRHGVVMPPARKGLGTAAKVFIAALVVLAVCGGGTAAALKAGVISFEPVKQPEAPVTPVAETPKKMATSKVDGALVFYQTAKRGTVIEVTGEDGDFYTGKLDGVNVLVEKKWVRLASAAQPKAWKGYANDMAPLYKTAFLLGDPIATLPLNTEVEVVDEQDGWVFVKADGKEGYARRSDFRTEDEKRAEDEAAEAAAQAEEQGEEYYYDDGGWYDGGWSGYSGGETYYEPEPTPTPTPDPTPSSPGSDGQEIVLVGYHPAPKPFIETAYAAEASSQSAASAKSVEKGVVLSDGVSLYLAKLDRGDAVEQADPDEKGGDVATVKVLVDGVQGTVARSLVKLEDDKPFAAVNAYAREGAVVFADYPLTAEKRTCETNDVLRLVDEYDENYVVEESGVFTYVPKKSVSLTKLEVEKKEEPAEEAAEEESSEWSGDYYYEEPYYEDYTPSYEPAPEPAPAPAPSEPTEEWTDAKL